MNEKPEDLFEDAKPLDESKLVANQSLVEAILTSPQSGPVMTPHEFIAWLYSH